MFEEQTRGACCQCLGLHSVRLGDKASGGCSARQIGRDDLRGKSRLRTGEKCLKFCGDFFFVVLL